MANITLNGSDTSDPDENRVPWSSYLEATLLVIVCCIGLLLNIRVMLTAFAGSGYRSAKQKLLLLFGLSLSDSFVCCLRGPCIISMILFRADTQGEYICAFWIFSFAFILVAMVTNMVIAMQRRMIVFAYQKYLSTFTSRRTLVFTVLLWAGVTVFFVPVYIGLQMYGRISDEGPVCHVHMGRVPLDKTASFIVRLVISMMFVIVPIVILVVCYISIVVQICRTGLLRLEKVDERACYRRVMHISLARLLLALFGWMPYILYVIVTPMTTSLYEHAHYLDFLVIVQAALSPVITMQDTEFRDQVNGINKKRYWSIFGKSRRAPREVSDHITSANMKTQGVLQD